MAQSEAGQAIDRLERAAMAYERLGKLTRDGEKTRTLRKETIAELAAARKEMLKLCGENVSKDQN